MMLQISPARLLIALVVAGLGLMLGHLQLARPEEEAARQGLSSGPPFVSTGDGHWVWQNPRPQGNRLSSVYFVGPQTGWVVGEGGTILKTTDGGQNWVGQRAGGTFNFASVFFLDYNRGWAAGSPGTILKTEDGGSHWVQQDSGSTGWLNAIYFVDQQNGWAVGGGEQGTEGGLILRTADGGATWQRQHSRASVMLYSGFFFDPNRGWVVGMFGKVLKTEDGGITGCPRTQASTAT